MQNLSRFANKQTMLTATAATADGTCGTARYYKPGESFYLYDASNSDFYAWSTELSIFFVGTDGKAESNRFQIGLDSALCVQPLITISGKRIKHTPSASPL